MEKHVPVTVRDDGLFVAFTKDGRIAISDTRRNAADLVRAFDAIKKMDEWLTADDELGRFSETTVRRVHNVIRETLALLGGE